ncbi:MAG: sigma 54-interacting transcriptional regulator [Ndongobacter sp.]|nr:sigma 54-interacting transcriptional regulator [Ndongobacter sp.]
MPKNESGVMSLLRGSTAEINSQLSDIFNSIYDGLYITDGHAVTILINEAYQKISGLTAKDVLGRNMQDIVSDGLIDRSGTLYVLERRMPVTMNQTFRTGKKALITSKPCFDENDQIVMVITVVRDMTEIYDLEARYRENEARHQSAMSFVQRNQRSLTNMIATDPQTQATLRIARKVAALDSTVLLLGETGVGKELFARYIYENSLRSDKNYIGINCGAISPTLIESELFGYEKGAFTGASKEGKMGIFESADKGTVFLDEIGDLPMDMQVHLLRVLQEMQVKRVGSVKSIHVNVRIIAATNRDLWEMVKGKTFREDLYYRLNVVPITIPPLRERREDIIPLMESFLVDVNKKYRFQRHFSEAAKDKMYHYSWPGNVRQLKNVVEQAAILCEEDCIQPADLPIAFHSRKGVESFSLNSNMNLKEELARLEWEYIRRAYEKHGTVRAAAASLSMDAATFVRKRKRYGEMFQK